MRQKNIELGHAFSEDWKRQAKDIDFATYKFDPFMNEDFRGSLTLVVNDVDLSFPSACLLDLAKNLVLGLSHLTLFEESFQYGFPDTEFWIGMTLVDDNVVLSCNYLPEKTSVPSGIFLWPWESLSRASSLTAFSSTPRSPKITILPTGCQVVSAS